MTWMLVALVVAPSVLGPAGGVAELRAAAAPGRECPDPWSGDPDPVEESDPVEDAAEEGQGNEYLRAASVVLVRPSTRRMPCSTGLHPDHHDRAIRPGPRDPERSSLAGSGRMIRRWIQSHLC